MSTIVSMTPQERKAFFKPTAMELAIQAENERQRAMRNPKQTHAPYSPDPCWLVWALITFPVVIFLKFLL
jgi:hypothetical protein